MPGEGGLHAWDTGGLHAWDTLLSTNWDMAAQACRGRGGQEQPRDTVTLRTHVDRLWTGVWQGVVEGWMVGVPRVPPMPGHRLARIWYIGRVLLCPMCQ